ncbi:MAG: choice-of-anchor B family protein [Thermoanaerobaculia bacterium]|nr:MAG: choice-of-anchor B family protein [Thermoanaerobaculia bacterium]
MSPLSRIPSLAPPHRALRGALALALAGVFASAPATAAQGPARSASPEQRLADYRARFLADREPAWPGEAPEHFTPCVAGQAGSWPCANVDLYEQMPLASLGGASSANDIWGWTDPLDGKEYALVGLSDGTAFVDISDPAAAVYLGRLPSHTGSSTWRDIKTYQDHAYVVSDANGNHGLQVFDLTRLRTVVSPPVTFTEDAWYGNIGSVHNLAINEATGFAYLVGGSSGATQCSGGLHMVNIQSPESPVFAGCFSGHGYSHDTQCVVYAGPDTAHVGKEVCFSSNGPSEQLGIVDVSNKAAPVVLSSTPYAGSAYPHQGWLTEDHRYFLLDDELDESNFGHNTRTRVWDVSNLDAPVLLGHFSSPTPAIDHNQYVRGSYVFQANYRSGLRVLRIDDAASAQLTQIGYFDVYPSSDTANFNGAWSVYPYFESGIVVVSGIEQGLFVLRPTNLCEIPVDPSGLSATPNGDNRIDLAWTGSGTSGNTFDVERAFGGCGGTFETLTAGLVSPAYSDTTPSGGVTYGYRVRERDDTGFCQSGYSACVEASTTGACTAPPLFAGLAAASSPGTSVCRVDLAWAPATPVCAGPVTYTVYRDPNPDFEPSAANRIATGVAGPSWQDFTAPSLEPVTYVVRAFDADSGVEETNLVHRSTRATGPISDGTFATGAEPGDPILDTFAPLEPDAPEHAGWHVVDTRSHAGTYSFHSGTGSDICVTLEADLELTAGQTSQLSFWTAWDIEQGWDGGVIELSTDGGGSWAPLTPAGGYPGTISNAGNACGIAVGRGAFTGTGQLTFQSKTVGLAAWSGQAIRLRWQYGSDGFVNEDGWFVDDIAVTHAQLPGACIAAQLFVGDFEEGDTSDWSSTTP